jgi:hypothetical protein
MELERQRRHRANERAGFDLGPLFDAAVATTPAVPPMATHDDYRTSRDAADRVAVRAGSLRDHVLQAIRSRPGITDPELERLPQFADCGASTVRKRRSELLKMGYLRSVGSRDGATQWEVVDDRKH